MKEEDVKKNNLCNYYTDYFFIIVVCCNLLHFLKYNVLYKSISYKLMVQIWFIFV